MAKPPGIVPGVWADGLEDLAATYSPVPWDTVPWALGVFTAEFGMGSGAGPPPKPPGRPTHPVLAGCDRRQAGRGRFWCVWCMLQPLSEDDFRAWHDLEPLGRLGPVSCARCRACTPGLS